MSLRVVVAYHRLPLPSRGDTIQFQPLDNSATIEFTRHGGIPGSLPDAGVTRSLLRCVPRSVHFDLYVP